MTSRSMEPAAAEFVVEGAGEEYDAPDIEPNRKSRFRREVG
jgi:hypothetical protein